MNINSTNQWEYFCGVANVKLVFLFNLPIIKCKVISKVSLNSYILIYFLHRFVILSMGFVTHPMGQIKFVRQQKAIWIFLSCPIFSKFPGWKFHSLRNTMDLFLKNEISDWSLCMCIARNVTSFITRFNSTAYICVSSSYIQVSNWDRWLLRLLWCS